MSVFTLPSKSRIARIDRRFRRALISGRWSRAYFWLGFVIFGLGVVLAPWVGFAWFWAAFCAWFAVFLLAFAASALLASFAAFRRRQIPTALFLLAFGLGLTLACVSTMRGWLVGPGGHTAPSHQKEE